MRRSLSDLLMILLCGTIISFGGLGALALIAVQQVEKEQKAFNQRFLANVQDIVLETTRTLDRLNRAPNVSCNDEFLVFLRQVIFQAQHIKDIGYFEQDYLVCTTGLGNLDPPILSVLPDAITSDGYQLWMNAELALFNSDYVSFVTRKGRFNIINERRDVPVLGAEIYDWELVYQEKDADVMFSILGKTGLFRHATSHAGLKVDYDQRVNILCDRVVAFCIVSVSNLYSMLTPKIVAWSAVYFLVFFGLSCVSLNKVYNNYYSIAQRIKRGVRNNSFFPLFQPIVCLTTNKVIGCEALARFKDGYGELCPDEFIPLLLELKLSIPFTNQMMSDSIALLDKQSQIPTGFKVNFNVFPYDVTESNIARIIASNLPQARFNICFEITESEAIDTLQAIDHLDKLRAEGFQIAIDDFGTGYSNLAQLEQLNVDFLKIDRSFVMALESDNVKSTFVKHITALANELDVEIVAEGIETRRQHQILSALGVSQGQGWLFGKPMNAKSLANLIQSQQDASFY